MRLPRLMGDLAVLTGGQLLSKLLNFVVFAVLARRLDPASYGALELVVGCTAAAAMVIDCGLGTVGVRRMAEARGAGRALVTAIVTARALAALLVVPLAVGVLSLVREPAIPPELLWTFCASLFVVAVNQEWILQGAERMVQVAIAQVLRAGLFAAVVLALVRDTGSLGMVGWAELVSVIAAAAWCLVGQRAVTAGSPDGEARSAAKRSGPGASMRSMPSMLPGLLREGLPIGLANALWGAAQYLPLFLVGAWVGGESFGWFAAAVRLVVSITTFAFVYHFNLYPSLARAAASDRAMLAGLLASSMRLTAWCGAGGALVLGLVAGPVLGRVFGASFAEGAPLLAILVWTVPCMLVSWHARWALILAGAQRFVFLSQVATVAATPVLGIPAILAWGATGGALATVVAAVIGWIVLQVGARATRTAVPAWTIVLAPLGCAAAATAVAAAVEKVFDRAVPAGALAGIGVFAVAWIGVYRTAGADARRILRSRAGAEAGVPAAPTPG